MEICFLTNLKIILGELFVSVGNSMKLGISGALGVITASIAVLVSVVFALLKLY